MIKITQSMSVFLWKFHRDKLSLVMFGHFEVITKEIFDEYMEWCQTEEGKQYLKGGSKYNVEYAKSIGAE